MLLAMNRAANPNAGDGRIAASQQRSGQKLVANERRSRNLSFPSSLSACNGVSKGANLLEKIRGRSSETGPSKRPSRNCVEGRLDRLGRPTVGV